MECEYLYGWIKKKVTYPQILPKVVKPRDKAGNAEAEEDFTFYHETLSWNALEEPDVKLVWLTVMLCSLPLQQFFQDGARIESAFRKYFHRADPDQKGDSVEIIVCHANVIRYFVCR